MQLGDPFPPKEFVDWTFDPQFGLWWETIHGAAQQADPTVPYGYLTDKSTVIKVQAVLELLKQGAWEGAGPSFDDVATAVKSILEGTDKDSAFFKWTPDTKKLPWPLQYKLEAMVQSVVNATTEESKKDKAKLNPNQLVLEDARSTMRSNVLLSMKAAELAGKSAADAEYLKNEIQKIAVLLWGKTIELQAPADVEETKVLEWYQDQIDLLTAEVSADPVKVPGTGVGAGDTVVPLVAQYNLLLEQYKQLQTDMVNKGTEASSQPQLLVLLGKSEDLRDQIQILIADIFGMLSNLVEIVKGEGGMMDFSLIGIGYLDAIQVLVNIDGIDVGLQPTEEEAKAAEKAAQDLADFLKKAKDILAWAWGLINGLKKYADGIDIEFSAGTQDRIEELKVTISDEFPQEEEKSSWWLLLLAAAAAAAQQKK